MKCSNCGRMYDYEKYFGICPKCGTFNRQEPKEQEDHVQLHQQYDAGLAEDSHEKKSLYTFVEDGVHKKTETEKKLPGKKGKGCLVYGVICLIISFVSFLGIGMVLTVQEDKLKEAAILEDELPTETAAQGERFTAGIYEFEIISARILEHADMRPEFPTGEMCIAVRIRRTTEEEYPDYSECPEYPYISYEDESGRLVYKECLDANSEFGSYEKYYGIELLDSYAYRYEMEAEGELVFFVAEEAEEITVCLEERQRRENSVEQLLNVYEVKLPLSEGVEE